MDPQIPRFVNAPALTRTDSIIRARSWMDSGISVIADLSAVQDTDTRRLLAVLLTLELETAALSRRDTSPELRRLYWALIDEWPTVMTSEKSLATVLEQTRKHGRCKLVFAVGRDSATTLAQQLTTLDPALSSGSQYRRRYQRTPRDVGAEVAAIAQRFDAAAPPNVPFELFGS